MPVATTAVARGQEMHLDVQSGNFCHIPGRQQESDVRTLTMSDHPVSTEAVMRAQWLSRKGHLLPSLLT